MTAVTEDLNTKRSAGSKVSILVAASTTLYFGILLCRDSSGYAVQGDKTADLQFAGVANEAKDNASGAAGDVEVEAWDEGVFRLALEGGGAAITDIGTKVYVFDNATVCKASQLTEGDEWVYVGEIVKIDDDTSYVWVDIQPHGSRGIEPAGLYTVQVAGVNATTFDLSTAAADYDGSGLIVDTVLSVESFVTATGAHDGLKVETTDWTLAAGVVSTVGDETANTWKMTFLGRLQ